MFMQYDQAVLTSVEMAKSIGDFATLIVVGLIVTVMVAIIAGVGTLFMVGDEGSVMRTTPTPPKKIAKQQPNPFLDYLSGWFTRVKQYW